MKKEVVLAIIFGLLVALGLTFGFYFFFQGGKERLQEQKKLSVADKITLDPNKIGQKNASESGTLRIIYPTHESVETQSDITFEGTAFPDQLTVIFINDENQILTADSTGNVKTKLELESGSNIIGFYAIDPQTGETEFKEITVIHSNKSLEENLVTDQEVIDAAAGKE